MAQPCRATADLWPACPFTDTPSQTQRPKGKEVKHFLLDNFLFVCVALLALVVVAVSYSIRDGAAAERAKAIAAAEQAAVDAGCAPVAVTLAPAQTRVTYQCPGGLLISVEKP